MVVTVLGTGCCIPRPGRASPGFVIEMKDSVVLVDPSTGSLGRMENCGISVSRITQVVISHLHPDHTGDLVPLLFAVRNSRRYLPLRIELIGPPGLQRFYTRLCSVYSNWIQLDEDRLKLVEIDQGKRRFSDWSLESERVQHTAHSQGFRFRDSEGFVLAYSGDTGYCDALVRLLEGANAALVESSYPSNRETEGHLTPLRAGQAALEAGLDRIFLTHLYPECEGVDLIAELRASGYSGEAAIARDGQRIQVGESEVGL